MSAALPNPSLPQKDGPIERRARLDALAKAQQAYVWTHDTQIKPLGAAASVPKGEGVSPVLAGTVALQALDLLGDLLARATRIFGTRQDVDPDSPGVSSADAVAARAMIGELRDLHDELTGLVTTLHADPAQALATTAVEGGARAVLRRVEKGALGAIGSLLKGDRAEGKASAAESPGERVFSILEEILKKLLTAAGQALLRYLGLFGTAGAMNDFLEQFQIIRPPDVHATWHDDRMFAWMRVGGPNPVMLTAIPALPENFPVTEAQFQATMGVDDTLAAAGAEGRLFLVDYKALSGVVGGDFPDNLQKYLAVPLALFAVPRAGEADRELRAVAIQLSQTPGLSSPIFTPQDPGWRLAKVHVQVADGNYHELITHLGRTHLVLEAFAVSTPRQLAPQHPLHVLLAPHLEGTIFINNAALGGLIAPGGTVDRILSGTIDTSVAAAVQGVLDFGFNGQMLPNSFATRGVADTTALPNYPYRDDGLLIWAAIHDWVREYVAIYYNSDADVQGDYELQGWLAELMSPQGGALTDIGETGPSGPQIRTVSYLVDMLTLVIFTASAQHAAVNFPQNFIMSYTPAMPLAAYAPPPSSVSPAAESDKALFAALPPLQQSVVQLSLGYVLGGTYFTRLGDYNRDLRGGYFWDERVTTPLQDFQRALNAATAMIGARNLRRIPYVLLLPAEIPASINI